MKERDYQLEAVNSIFTYFGSNSGNPLVAMPTGTGKSVVIGSFVRKVMTTFAGQRIIMLTHVKELISQNYDKLLRVWPTACAGIYSAGLGKKQHHFPVIFAGIASVHNCPELFGHIDLVLVDECHLISPKETTMYGSFILALKRANPQLKVIGFTATPFRLGLGLLTEGTIFTDFCFDVTGRDAFNRFVQEGYLCPLIPKRTSMEYDVSQVGKSGGEYKLKELQDTVDKDELTYRAIQEMIAIGQVQDRKHWLIFASGIEHAEHVAAGLDSLGVSSVVIHSKMKSEQRDSAIADFIAGKYTAAVNNNVLTTGFDFPGIDLIGVLRPTSSPVLWVQMLGRGTRPKYAEGFDLTNPEGRVAAIQASDKHNCLVLDFAGNTRRLGPVNDPVLPRKKGKGKGLPAPVKICEQCSTYNHASVRVCICCGFEFPRFLHIKKTAFTDEVMVGEMPKVTVFQVSNVVYKQFVKPGKPPSIQVNYYCGLSLFKEFVCLEHPGYAGKKAREWWRARAECPPPQTTGHALKLLPELRVPTHIRVWVNKQFPEVIAADYTGTGFASS